jgi:ribonucleoside-diphosphate reductase alpha chain
MMKNFHHFKQWSTLMDIQRSNLANFTFKQTYAKYLPTKRRRENWEESVDRLMNMHATKFIDNLEIFEDLNEIEDSLRNKDILGSQRSLQFGGKAILEKPWRIFNCTTSFCDRPRFFAESLWLLLCGCGVGYSVQTHHVSKLPPVITSEQINTAQMKVHMIKDTIEGWADALDALIQFYLGQSDTMPIFNYSLVRKKGSPLSHGGKAPGPIPLKFSLQMIEKVLVSRAGKKLRSIDCLDIVCIASDCVLSGGVRRSATIAIFSMDDADMWTAKTGNWWATHPFRARANISAVAVKNKLDKQEFMKKFLDNVPQWGEPGFVFTESTEFCFNPCVEISMCPMLITDQNGAVVDEYTLDLIDPSNRDKYESEGYTFQSGWQACNLTEVNASKFKSFSIDAIDAFYIAVKNAVKLGTLQASYTKSEYLGKVSEQIVEREALLGVSLTGLANSAFFFKHEEERASFLLKSLAEFAIVINKQFAKKIGINQAARITCVKPSGTASVILGCASGIHPEHARRFLRHVQVPADSALVQKFEELNPQAVKTSVWSANGTDKCLIFAVECNPENVFKNDLKATEFLSLVKMVYNSWVKHGTAKPLSLEGACHNVSNTCNVRSDEWEQAGEFVFDNQAYFCGVSFLGMTGDYDYQQPPFKAVYDHIENQNLYFDEVEQIEKAYLEHKDEDRYKSALKFATNRKQERAEAFELWHSLRSSNAVDFDSVLEGTDETVQAQEVACAGGACII